MTSKCSINGRKLRQLQDKSVKVSDSERYMRGYKLMMCQYYSSSGAPARNAVRRTNGQELKIVQDMTKSDKKVYLLEGDVVVKFCDEHALYAALAADPEAGKYIVPLAYPDAEAIPPGKTAPMPCKFTRYVRDVGACPTGAAKKHIMAVVNAAIARHGGRADNDWASSANCIGYRPPSARRTRGATTPLYHDFGRNVGSST